MVESQENDAVSEIAVNGINMLGVFFTVAISSSKSSNQVIPHTRA
jgi:hypothetical protein